MVGIRWVEFVGADQVSLLLRAGYGDDVLDTEAVAPEEVVHGVSRPILFKRFDLPAHETGRSAVVAEERAPGDGDIPRPSLDVDDAVVDLGEGTVVDPDVVAGHVHRDEVPALLIILALRGLVPLPQFVELQVANDHVVGALHVEGRMPNRRPVRGEDRQAVLVLDVDEADARGY